MEVWELKGAETSAKTLFALSRKNSTISPLTLSWKTAYKNILCSFMENWVQKTSFALSLKSEQKIICSFMENLVQKHPLLLHGKFSAKTSFAPSWKNECKNNPLLLRRKLSAKIIHYSFMENWEQNYPLFLQGKLSTKTSFAPSRKMSIKKHSNPSHEQRFVNHNICKLVYSFHGGCTLTFQTVPFVTLWHLCMSHCKLWWWIVGLNSRPIA